MLRILLYLSVLNFLTSWIVKTNVPKSLWGKKIMLNGPREENNYFSPFDGIGHITSIVFKENECIISEVIVPKQPNEISFPLSDFLQRDYFKLLSKLPHVFFKTKRVQSGTRNTAVVKYNNNYYAVEESCTPIKLIYNDNHEIQYDGLEENISRMSVHMPDEYTMFSYMYPTPNGYPLKLNNTLTIPWMPKKYPFIVHDCKITENKQFYIFPIMSSGMGRMMDYFKNIIDMPIDEQNNKAGWLIYDIVNNTATEIFMDEFADVFHITEIKQLYRNVYKIYASFVYNFPMWLTGAGKLDIKLKEVVIDIDNYKIIKIHDTGLKMDFSKKVGDELIGSSLEESPSVIKYNTITKENIRLCLPGKTVREVIPFDDYFIYFSHDINESFLYIVNATTSVILNKINIPHRAPGFHTTLFD